MLHKGHGHVKEKPGAQVVERNVTKAIKQRLIQVDSRKEGHHNVQEPKASGNPQPCVYHFPLPNR